MHETKLYVISTPLGRLTCLFRDNPFSLLRIKLPDSFSKHLLHPSQLSKPACSGISPVLSPGTDMPGSVTCGIHQDGELSHSSLNPLIVWLNSYFAKNPGPVPLEMLCMEGLTPITQKTLMETAMIPFGKTATYGQIAERIGRPGAARFVGSVMAKNPFPVMIPCHRVVRNDGVGSYGGGTKMKKAILDFEKL